MKAFNMKRKGIVVISGNVGVTHAMVGAHGRAPLPLAIRATHASPLLVLFLLLGAGPLFADSPTIIPVGKKPVAAAFSPTLRLAAVANQKDNTISVIDLATRSVISTVPVGKGPSSVAMVANGKNLIATSNGRDGTISLLDFSTGKVTTVPVGSKPAGVALAPDLGLALVPVVSNKNAHLVLVELSTQTVQARIDIGKGKPISVAVDADRKVAAVALSKNIILVDLVTRNRQSTIQLNDQPVALAMDSPRGHLLLLTKQGQLMAVHPVTGRIETTQRVVAKGIGFTVNPVTDEVWVLATPAKIKGSNVRPTISIMPPPRNPWVG